LNHLHPGNDSSDSERGEQSSASLFIYAQGTPGMPGAYVGVGQARDGLCFIAIAMVVFNHSYSRFDDKNSRKIRDLEFGLETALHIAH
jgi:hypothetical protein